LCFYFYDLFPVILLWLGFWSGLEGLDVFDFVTVSPNLTAK